MGTNCSRVTVDGKGIVGLGLIGAELGFIIPALAGVRDEWWPYLVFPLIGAVGGAIGGWGVEEATRSQDLEEVDVMLLVVGVALIVPTVVGTLALTAYQPPEDSNDAEEGPLDDVEPTDDSDSVDAVHDGDTGDGESTEGATSSSPAAAMRELLAGGRGILRYDADGRRVIVAAPLPYSISTFTTEETERLHLAPSSDLVVPLVSASF